MDIATAKSSIGEMVYSFDAGDKMIPQVSDPHGPYKLLQVTKAGLAVLEGREGFRIPPSLLISANTTGEYSDR